MLWWMRFIPPRCRLIYSGGMNLTLMLLATLLSPSLPREEVSGTLRIPAEGGTVTIDLSRFKVEGFRITWSGGGKPTPLKSPGTYEIKNVRTGGDRNEIVIVHPSLKLRIVLKIVPGSTRICKAAWRSLSGKSVAVISLFDSGKGKWETEPVEKLTLSTAGGVRVNTLDLLSLPPLAKCGGGALYLLNNDQLIPWRVVALKYYRSIVTNDWEGFVSCYNTYDQGASDRNANCRLHWRAGRGWVLKEGVRKYVFSHVDEGQSDEKTRKLFFRRLNEKGGQIGMPLPITLELQKGRWVVTSPSQ